MSFFACIFVSAITINRITMAEMIIRLEVVMMNKMELLYEGKAKKVYSPQHPERLVVSYKDDATAYNGQKKGSISG